MGKGKRLRTNRQHGPSNNRRMVEVPADYPFDVDEHARRMLGEQGLQLLADNLWPQDCQTCGWELGTARPTVLIRELVPFMISTSLHHARCQPAAWTTNIRIGRNTPARLSYANQTFLWPLQHHDGQPDDRPLMLVNPALEEVGLRQDDHGRWAVTTVEMFRSTGLRTPGKDLIIDKPVPDISAELDSTILTVRVHDIGEQWEANVSDQFGARVRELGGTMLGVTTAVHPHHVTHPNQIVTLVTSGQVAMGWIALAGAEQPLTDMPAPENLKTYVLHYGKQHATVGELIATTDPALTPVQAQAWAVEHISVLHDLPDARTLIGWNQVSRDPNAWFTIDALSVDHFFVRRHDDAWTLVKVVSRIDGKCPADTEQGVQDWATQVARIRGGHRVLSWVPSPTTAPGFTTFHGAATPR